jgi:hypothetical protein
MIHRCMTMLLATYSASLDTSSRGLNGLSSSSCLWADLKAYCSSGNTHLPSFPSDTLPVSIFDLLPLPCAMKSRVYSFGYDLEFKIRNHELLHKMLLRIG